MRPALIFTLVSLAASAQAPEKKDLRAFFQANCVVCHGADGSARAADGRRLKGQDFTDAKDMKEMSDAKLAKTIRKGLFFGIRMPAFKDQLSEEEALALVQQVLRHAEKGKAIAPEAKNK